MLVRFVLNTDGVALRTDQLEGRDYLVAPMVMLVEGVHEGSDGPILYEEEDLAKTPVVWNHKPVVVYHPTMNGVGISACSPEVLNSQKVGLIMNTVFEKPKLRSEAWFEVDRLRKVDERVLNNLQKGIPTEVSTGLFIDNEKKNGVWRNERYGGIARNMRPDHLAILPDKIGACSLQKGAGLLMNEAKTRTIDNYKPGDVERFKIDIADFIDPDLKRFPILNQSSLDLAAHAIHSMGDKKAALARTKTIAERKGLKFPDWMNSPLMNSMMAELSYETRRCGIQDVLDKEYASPDSPWLRMAYVEAVFESFFIYEVGDGTMYKQSYSIAANGTISFVGGRTEVVEVTEYRTTGGAFVGNSRGGFSPNQEIPAMTKQEEKVNALITGNVYKEEHRPMLMGLGETQLDLICNATVSKPAPIPTPQVVPLPVTAPVVLSAEEYVRNAPPAIAEVLQNGLHAAGAEKRFLTSNILQKAPGIYTEADLMAKAPQELRQIAALANGGVTPVMNYGAQFPTAPVAPPPEHKETPLVRPVWTAPQPVGSK